MVKKKGGFLLVALVLVCALAGWTVAGAAPAYARAENWAYRETEKTAAADVFFICPTVYGGYNMPMDDAEAREDFVGATNMEKGIYDGDSRFFCWLGRSGEGRSREQECGGQRRNDCG